MGSDDLSEVLTIERSVNVSPWGRISFEESLTREHDCRVVMFDKTLIAYHLVCAVADELHILNLGVSKPYQGKGIGHVLMQDILEVACSKTKKVARLFLEVRASNYVAQNLYQQWQFKQISLRKAYYRTHQAEREDALIFMREF